MGASKQGADSPETPRTSWNSILTATPVVLTVLATIMAGLSNSEMTLAQYYRSLAAQCQSKAGDQWAFFQAKRIRGTNLEMTIDLLHATAPSGPWEVGQLVSAVDRLLAELRRAGKLTNQLTNVLGSARPNLGSAAASLTQKANVLRLVIDDSIATTEQSRNRLRQELARPEVQQALACLATQNLPAAATTPINDLNIVPALDAVRQRRPEDETTPLVRQIPTDALQRAIEQAEANVQAVEQADKPFSDVFGRVHRLLQEQVGSAQRFLRAARDFDDVLADLPGNATGALNEVFNTAAELARHSGSLRSIADDLNIDFKAAQLGYDARRYDREAQFNQEAAGLYEVQVRKDSASSERHRTRSKHFFYGMLAAQAGVTIATISLAVKHKSVLWSMASLAGIGAILFGLYVYLWI
jgi:Domain of unknown function (DUF4337)